MVVITSGAGAGYPYCGIIVLWNRLRTQARPHNLIRMTFHQNCVTLPASVVLNMIDKGRKITYRTFLKYVDVDHLAEQFPQYAWSLSEIREGNLRMKDDFVVEFYKSEFKGKPCVYVVHSAIEYVFIYQ